MLGRALVCVGICVAAACNESASAPPFPPDAPSTGDAPPSDASANAGEIACGTTATTCTIPGQVCCDNDQGPDQCIPTMDACNGRRLACDGPEDCPSPQECCLFAERSQCMTNGICGTTGVISEVMCHVDSDCDVGAG